jgi:geranylgeranyl diphosphate synthase type I
MADALDSLRAYRPLIDAEMSRFMTSAPELFGVELSEHSRQALQHLVEYSTRAGKRIRGSLAALTYDTAAGTMHAEQAIRLGVVLELMQNYLLIVDDVMDKSTLRRSQPTVHELYRELTTDFGGEHEANMLAVNIGVLAQHLANMLLSAIDVPRERLNEAFRVLHTNIAATGFGQLDDLYQQPGRDVSAEDIARKYRLKSSYYTFINPLQLGLVLAGAADERKLQACVAFGEPAGIAFQLHDDYLGIFGEHSKTGKPSLDDIREGKYTLLMHYALEHAAKPGQKLLRSILGNQAAKIADLQTVQEILETSGAKAYCRAQAQAQVDRAKDALNDEALGDEPFRETLAALVDFSVSRER